MIPRGLFIFTVLGFFRQENGLLTCQHTSVHLHMLATPHLWWEPQRLPETSPPSLTAGCEGPEGNPPLGERNYSFPTLTGSSLQEEKAEWYSQVGGNDKERKTKRLNSTA